MSESSPRKVVLVTRPVDQAEELETLLHARNFATMRQPAIEIRPSREPERLDAALRSLALKEYDWLVFSSANGARVAMERLAELFARPLDACGEALRGWGVKVAVVGSGTAKALRSYGIPSPTRRLKFSTRNISSPLSTQSFPILRRRDFFRSAQVEEDKYFLRNLPNAALSMRKSKHIIAPT